MRLAGKLTRVPLIHHAPFIINEIDTCVQCPLSIDPGNAPTDSTTNALTPQQPALPIRFRRVLDEGGVFPRAVSRFQVIGQADKLVV